jgi:hypothetical protein
MHELFKLEDITQDEMIMTKAYPKYKLSLCCFAQHARVKKGNITTRVHVGVSKS